MTKGRILKVAGPLGDQRIELQIENVRTQLFIRDRVADAARQALPPHARRPTKGTGRWSRGIHMEL